MTAKEKEELTLQALAHFCVSAGAPCCYQNWSPETLRDYLSFHAQHRTLAWMPAPSTRVEEVPQVLATGVAWQTFEWDVRRWHEKREHQFRWLPSNPKGDAVFFADFVCEAPEALPQLISEFGRRFPHWANLKWFTYRRGQLVELNRRHVRALLRLGRQNAPKV